MKQTDVLVIGAGIAGAVTAIEAAQAGLDVILLHRSYDPDQTNTRWAQGGIIYTGPGDSPEMLVRDILAAGLISLPAAARVLAAEGPALVKKFLIDELKVPFDRRQTKDEGGRMKDEERREKGEGRRAKGEARETRGREASRRNSISRTKTRTTTKTMEAVTTAYGLQSTAFELDVTEEAAHSLPRIAHCEDRTGRRIFEALMEAVAREPRIEFLRPWVAVDLLTLSHHSRRPLDIYEPNACIGAYVLDRQAGKVEPILARHTVLATGGLGELFLHTTNPRGARGDGIAMAYRAGARLLNLEYIQFHPTALYLPPAPRFLISESVRGEGGRLVLRSGEEFMGRHHPLGSLAPRDVVARAIHEEMLASDQPCVYLDITHKDADWIRARFPFIHGECQKLGLDITRQPIPVVPAAHYSCGGVATDLEGRTTIRRLWSVGEVACTGLHGANRLASTSLLEGLVFGARAARAIAGELAAQPGIEFPSVDPWIYEDEATDPALILQDWLTIKYTMWNYVGLARTHKRLKRARQILRELQDEVEIFYARSRMDDDLIGLRNGVQAALAVLYAAMENRTSRGCHYLADGAKQIESQRPEVKGRGTSAGKAKVGAS